MKHACIKMVLWWVVDRICPKTSDEGIAIGDWVSTAILCSKFETDSAQLKTDAAK